MKLSQQLFGSWRAWATALCLLCVFAGFNAPLAAQQFPRYETWRAQGGPWIRVGLQSPDKILKIYSPGTMLVLDGDKILETFDPGKWFYLVSTAVSGGQYWLQIKAQRSKPSLVQEKEELAGRFPGLSFSIVRVRNGLNALRIGPYDARAEVERIRTAMISEGYGDAFLIREKQGSRFQWVTQDFDKFEFKARDLALVRLDPELPIHYDGTAYRGILRFELSGGKIRAINHLPLETYLRGVVPSELGPQVFPQLEALKAQAIAARTYALKNLGRFQDRGYDICDSPACQAYEGTKNEDPLSDEAVKATEGLVLYHGDALIDALYTSTCGGETEDVENVFPGRAEPYLRGKTSYLANYQTWKLPPKPGTPPLAADSEHLAATALLWGFPAVPEFQGRLSGADLKTALEALGWVLGSTSHMPTGETVSMREFWTCLASLDFFLQAAEHQIHDRDLQRLLRDISVPESLKRFAGLVLRHDFMPRDWVRTFAGNDPLPRARAYELLFELCRTLGPAAEWESYRVEGVSGNRLHVSRGGRVRDIDLNDYLYYLGLDGDRWSFIEEPEIEELDRVYLLQTPFTAKLLRIEEIGGVASVDRFSVYDSWFEKKTLAELEQRARQYVPKIRGIRDIRIRERSKSGRVTLLEYVTDAGSFKVDGLRIRWSLGIRDNLFDMLPGYRDGRLVHVTFVGRGWGHGVGMSQVGAYGLARMGWAYDRILKHYYTGVEIRPYKHGAPATAQ